MMNCVRESVFEYTGRILDLYPSNKRVCDLPYLTIDNLRRRFESFMPDPTNATERESHANVGKKSSAQKGPSSPGCNKQGNPKKGISPDGSSLRQVMPVHFDSFKEQFDHWPA